MKLFNFKHPLPIFTLLCGILLGAGACQDNSTRVREPADLTTIPDGWDTAWDTTAADSSFTVADGNVDVYVIKKKNDVFEVNERDQVSLYYVGRINATGEVFATSWANGSTTPTVFQNLSSSSSLIEGFRLGILGMKEGERRTIVIPPEYGYGNSSRGTNGYDLRDDTLIYDIELASIN